MRDLSKMQELVGAITKDDLKHVDSYVCDDVGIFVPSTGFCGYAIQRGHTHPAYSFIILLKKSDSVVDTRLRPDENQYVAATLPPDIPHEEKTEDEFTRYIAIMASKRLVDSIFCNYNIVASSVRGWRDFLVPKEIMVFISRFMEEYEAGSSAGKKALDALGFLIVNDLLQSAYHVRNQEPLPKSRTVREAVEYIEQNFHSPIPVQTLAQHVNLSLSAFTRHFTQETGLPPAAYLLCVRLRKAKKLLRSSEYNITEIAQQCGFSSAAHLSSSFKKHYGNTPSDYRAVYANL